MQITTKYDMYQGLLNKMVGGHKRAGSSLSIGKPQTMNFSAYELQGVKYGDFSLRYTPSNLTFSEPNWDKIVTKREPTHPDDYYIDQIKELARKCFATGDMYEDESRAIYRGYVSSERRSMTRSWQRRAERCPHPVCFGITMATRRFRMNTTMGRIRRFGIKRKSIGQRI